MFFRFLPPAEKKKLQKERQQTTKKSSKPSAATADDDDDDNDYRYVFCLFLSFSFHCVLSPESGLFRYCSVKEPYGSWSKQKIIIKPQFEFEEK